MKIDFYLQFRTKVGQSLYLGGNLGVLGNNETTKALPMAFLRPLSGSGAYAVATEIMKTNGPDTLVGQIVSTMQGSTETTFYVLALYFGVVQIKRTRHALLACLLADSAGLLMAVWMCRMFLS